MPSELINHLRASAATLDPQVCAFYLRIPRSQVVLLQAYFELYDGVGTVRTITGTEPVVCIMTTHGQIEDCLAVLEAIRDDVQWEVAAAVD